MDLTKLHGIVPETVINQLPDCINKFQINTELRLAHFLAQCSHESNGFTATVENLNYGSQGLLTYFKRFFSTQQIADQYAHKQPNIANVIYANRMGNGTTASGDGWNFRGRGYIQLTGKNNYVAFGASINENVASSPDLVATKYPLLSAAWFWSKNGINAIADRGADVATVTTVTERVNGGHIGLDDRIARFNKIHAALG